MYLFDLRSPILDAFFFTVSVDRPSFAAIAAVGLSAKSLLSKLSSLVAQSPFKAFFFFAILCFLSLNDNGIKVTSGS